MINYEARINKFKESLKGKADAAFFPLSADLQYLAGVSRGMPTFGATHHPGEWVEGLWISPEKEPVMALTRMTASFSPPKGIDQVMVLGDHDDPAQFLKEVLVQLGFTEVKQIALGEATFAETALQLQRIFPKVQFSSATGLLTEQRKIKTEDEIATMRQAGRITEAAFEAVVGNLRHGMTELDVILETDYQLRKNGAFGPSFNTTLYVVGPDHELLFNQQDKTWPRKLTPPVSILFDFGAIYEGFCYDFGRTVSFGAPADDLRLAHQLVMASQAVGIAAMVAGKSTAEQVDAAARSVIEDAGMGETFRHRLGHSIGLDVHEPPYLTKGDQTILREGMLFTVEPSVLVPFAGSARVEDVVLVGPDGGIPLTTGFQSLVVVD
ncbi:Xaa-Pro peptidase family protein [bacterium]|nr:Xaa-Pro peptidase family protein [bacterium]